MSLKRPTCSKQTFLRLSDVPTERIHGEQGGGHQACRLPLRLGPLSSDPAEVISVSVTAPDAVCFGSLIQRSLASVTHLDRSDLPPGFSPKGRVNGDNLVKYNQNAGDVFKQWGSNKLFHQAARFSSVRHTRNRKLITGGRFHW